MSRFVYNSVLHSYVENNGAVSVLIDTAPKVFCAKSLEGGLYAVHDIVSGTETGDSICSG